MFSVRSLYWSVSSDSESARASVDLIYPTFRTTYHYGEIDSPRRALGFSPAPECAASPIPESVFRPQTARGEYPRRDPKSWEPSGRGIFYPVFRRSYQHINALRRELGKCAGIYHYGKVVYTSFSMIYPDEKFTHKHDVVIRGPKGRLKSLAPRYPIRRRN
jgi:hypothetical protein